MVRTARVQEPQTRVVGDVVLERLDRVKPNDWNPNELTAEQKSGLKYGLQTEGWIKAYALLIWGKDERGKTRDVIIDGEHRWASAVELGFEQGPMVFLDGITEAEAKAFTVELDQKRGRFNQLKLSDVVKAIQFKLGNVDIGLKLGFGKEELAKLVALPPLTLGNPNALKPSGEIGNVVSENPHVKTVPLFFSPDLHVEFLALVKRLGARYKLDNVTDTVMKALNVADTAAIRKG